MGCPDRGGVSKKKKNKKWKVIIKIFLFFFFAFFLSPPGTLGNHLQFLQGGDPVQPSKS